MTHGEKWFEQKTKMFKRQSLREEDNLVRTSLPKRMDKKTAAEYYNEKLKKYWRQCSYVS